MAAAKAGSSLPEGYSYHAELSERFYNLDPVEQEFLSSQTGISDPEELKKHALQVQKEAYAVSGLPTPCQTSL